MAMQIRSDLDLPTLRIVIDPQRTNFTEAVFQVVRGRDTPSEVARCSLRDLGLPNTLTGLRPVDDDRLTVPPRVVAALQEAVGGLGPSPLPPESALWLEFPSPRGFLYIAPWGRLLEPLGRPLFRLPNHLVRPQAPGRTLEVAICASAPRAKSAFDPPRILEPLVTQYLTKTGRDVTVHVFTDDSWFAAVRALFNDSGLPGVVVHDPAEAVGYEPPSRAARIGTSEQRSSPWLLWMRATMGTKPLDFVHFVSHGYLSGHRGAIAVASSPTVNTDQQWSRFIGSVELNTFLSQVGAWGLGLTGPYDNFSEVGLRELADAIALVRPGVTVTHSIEHDAEGGQFGLVLQTIFAPAPRSTIRCRLPRAGCTRSSSNIQDEYQDDLHLNADGSSAFVGAPPKRRWPKRYGVLGSIGLTGSGDAADAMASGLHRCGDRPGCGHGVAQRRGPGGAARQPDVPASAQCRRVTHEPDRHPTRRRGRTRWRPVLVDLAGEAEHLRQPRAAVPDARPTMPNSPR